MRKWTVKSEFDRVESLKEILGLVCELEGALIYHCFPNQQVDGVTEEEKQNGYD